MATLTLALNGQHSSGGSPLLLEAMILIDMFSLLFYLRLFDNRIYSIGLLGTPASLAAACCRL